MNKAVYVHIELDGQSYLVGKLWSRLKNARESATFEYDSLWLEHPKRFSLEPALFLGPGPQHTPSHKALFGALGDSAPDRWGRVLMRRAEKLNAAQENRMPQTLNEIDYLLRVYDQARQGALRFSENKEGPFLNPGDTQKIPPVIELPKLLAAIENITDDTFQNDDLKLLLAPGSSLGGARPKASIRDLDGCLSIAKFPHAMDEINAVLWEALALTLAKKSGITVPSWRLEKIGNKSILILKRFDREKQNRIPFLSAMSMLSAHDNEFHSYLEIADMIRQHGADPKKDLSELWRRIIFNICIANTDDHLRNHGFLYESSNGWRLSPAYDLNPVPMEIKPRVLSTAITFDDATGSIALAKSVAQDFDITSNEADRITIEVQNAVMTWKNEAKKLGIASSEIALMASAFSTE